MKSTLIAATIAAIALTAAIASPALASKNDGRFALSPQQQAKAKACDDVWKSYNVNAAIGMISTNPKEAAAANEDAAADEAKAKSLGCGWAQ
jgi:hypothetical protein